MKVHAASNFRDSWKASFSLLRSLLQLVVMIANDSMDDITKLHYDDDYALNFRIEIFLTTMMTLTDT